jgi:hypothetical protein
MTTRNKQKTSNLFGGESWLLSRYTNIDHPLDNWKSMPEFDCKSPQRYAEIRFLFDDEKSVEEFSNKAECNITNKTADLWYPQKQPSHEQKMRIVSDRKPEHQPKYPIYLPSKGRWEIRLTSDALIKMGVKHFIVVEESQYENYKAAVDPEWVTLLILPQKYLDEYDTFDNLGTTKSKGPGAARNFAWDHSISLGYKRHWVMDDNIKCFYRMIEDKRVIVSDGAIIRAMEDHADCYENVVMSGPHYKFFAIPNDRLLPFIMNTRIYSCNLILNSAPYRWRGRYNEDTDISLRMLKDGHVTLQYYAFLCAKAGTQVVKGGNTEEFYAKEGTLPKSQMLVNMHPDVAKVEFKYGRWHHYVDYLPYKQNRFIPAKTPCYSKDPEYGMKLVDIAKKKTDEKTNSKPTQYKTVKKSSQYYNPEGEVINDKKQRNILVRFKTKADFDLFVAKLDIKLSPKTKKFKYVSNSLSEFFG